MRGRSLALLLILACSSTETKDTGGGDTAHEGDSGNGGETGQADDTAKADTDSGGDTSTHSGDTPSSETADTSAHSDETGDTATDPTASYEWSIATPPSLIGSTHLNGVWGAAAAQVWAVGDDGEIIFWNGSVWTRSSSPVPTDEGRHLEAVWGLSETEVWTGGYSGTVVFFDGTSWELQEDPEIAYFSFWGSSSSSVWGVGGAGSWGGAQEFDGSEWTEAVDFTSGALVDVIGFASDDIWALVQDGRFQHYDGSEWSDVEDVKPRASYMYGLWGAYAADIWAVGTAIHHYNGGHWSVIEESVTATLRDAWGTSTDDVWAVGTYGIVMHWDGSEWTEIDHGLTEEHLYGVWVSADGQVWAVGNNATILHFGPDQR